MSEFTDILAKAANTVHKGLAPVENAEKSAVNAVSNIPGQLEQGLKTITGSGTGTAVDKGISNFFMGSGKPTSQPAKATPKTAKASTPTPTEPSLQQTINQVTDPYVSTLQHLVSAYKAYNPASTPGFSSMSPQLQSAVTNMQKLTGKALTNLVPAEKRAIGSTVQSNQIQDLMSYLASALIYRTYGNQSLNTDNAGIQALWQGFQNLNQGQPFDSTPVQNKVNSTINQLLPQSAGSLIPQTSGAT